MSFQPLYGKLSDIFGLKQVLIFAYLTFGLGTLFCGLSRNMTELFVARALAGIGGCGVITLISVLLNELGALQDRSRWQGYMNIVWALGALLGAPSGGMMVDGLGWRWYICP